MASLRLTGSTVLCPLARQFSLCLVLAQPTKTGNHPNVEHHTQTFETDIVTLRFCCIDEKLFVTARL